MPSETKRVRGGRDDVEEFGAWRHAFNMLQNQPEAAAAWGAGRGHGGSTVADESSRARPLQGRSKESPGRPHSTPFPCLHIDITRAGGTGCRGVCKWWETMDVGRTRAKVTGR
eukprot:364731-Chlamydomonas_euryale.AAC.16